MKLVAGIHNLNVPNLFGAANRRIIMHAAVYGNFVRSREHIGALRTALGRPEFEGVDIIAVGDDTCCEWLRPFLHALRFDFSRQAVDEEMRFSRLFLDELSAEFPHKVRLHGAHRLPCLPVIIVDDTIVFGQYAHAAVHAPGGFWGTVNADVQTLLEWADRGRPPRWATDEQLAAFRLVAECVRAMNGKPQGAEQ